MRNGFICIEISSTIKCRPWTASKSAGSNLQRHLTWTNKSSFYDFLLKGSLQAITWIHGEKVFKIRFKVLNGGP